MTEKELDAICDQIAEGKSLRSICREIGRPESTVRYWLSKDADSFAHLARARELGCDALADECIEIADDARLDPADRRVRIETRLKLIGKWSQRYSDRLTVNSTKVVTHRYDLGSLDTAELEQLEALLAKSERGPLDPGEPEPASLH